MLSAGNKGKKRKKGLNGLPLRTVLRLQTQPIQSLVWEAFNALKKLYPSLFLLGTSSLANVLRC